jgi:hypothetical protein
MDGYSLISFKLVVGSVLTKMAGWPLKSRGAKPYFPDSQSKNIEYGMVYAITSPWTDISIDLL